MVDRTIRSVVADSRVAPPAPWSAAAEFRAWLAPRYWQALHESRGDLGAAFPDPEQRSATDFRRWCRGAFSFDNVPLLDRARRKSNAIRWSIADHLRNDGLNLVGYLTRQSGLGDVARRLREAVAQAGLPYSTIATQRTASPMIDTADISNRAEFTNSVCVVNADQFPFLADDFPNLFAATKRMIGYWFWELEHIPLHMRRSFALVDEVWAGSRFVTDAFAAVVVGTRSPRADTHRRAPAVEAWSRRFRRAWPTPASDRSSSPSSTTSASPSGRTRSGSSTPFAERSHPARAPCWSSRR